LAFSALRAPNPRVVSRARGRLCEWRANGTLIAKQNSQMLKYVVGGALVVVLVLVALPATIRAHTRSNEAHALLDMKSVIASEQNYAAANYGYFAPLTSLTRADDGEIGIPGYLDTAPDFLSEDMAREVRLDWISRGGRTGRHAV
jgi:hypothetical protein